MKVKGLKIKGIYLDDIINGRKSIEGRLSTKYFSDLEEGSILILYDERANVVRALVKRVTKYNSFYRMLREENFKKVVPQATNFQEALDVYKKIYGERDRDLDVLAIEIEVIDFLIDLPYNVEERFSKEG